MIKVRTRSPAEVQDKLESRADDIKTSPSFLYKDVECLKLMLSGEDPLDVKYWKTRQDLAQLLESILLVDLDYAIYKKVEQDLWNYVFRHPIAACQSKAKEQKNASNAHSKSHFATILENASGFYLQLLQKLCCAYGVDLPCHPRDSVYGITKEFVRICYPVVKKPNMSSVLYICQHCLVHLGDIARYRGQSLQAENFYRHAVDLVPSNGQPYNQLALLEAASGEKLSTVFFYIRSLAVQYPFPAARTNLYILFSKMSSDGTDIEGKTRMTAFEYVTIFLQFHACIHLNSDIKKAEKMQNQLNSSLPALIIAERFETWQLVQMVAVCLFAIDHEFTALGYDKQVYEQGNAVIHSKSLIILEELLGNLLYAFLFPLHASLEPIQTATYYTLPAVKIIIDWIVEDTNVIQHESPISKPQLLHALCKMLNDLDVVSKTSLDHKKFEDIPLPEDWDLQCFLPLKMSQRNLKFSISSETPSDTECTWLRASRLCHSGEIMAKKGLSWISVSEESGRRRFKTVYVADIMPEKMLLKIQELSISTSEEASNQVIKSIPSVEPTHLSVVHPKNIHQDGNMQQEVRFKLDDIQLQKEKCELDEDERTKEVPYLMTGRRIGKNVAMQAIFQQQAAQNSANLMNPPRNVEYGKEQALNYTHDQVSMNRSQLHQLPPEQYNSSLQVHQNQQAIGLGNERDTRWLTPFSMHQSGVSNVGQVVRSNSMSNFIQGTVQHIVQPTQSAPDFNYQSKSTTQTPHLIGKAVSTPQQAFLANQQNIMWNYMNFMTSYQHSNPQVVMPPSNEHQQANQIHSQTPNFYLMNNSGMHQKLQTPLESTIQSSIMPTFHPGSGDSLELARSQNPGIFHEKSQDLSSHQLCSNVWKPDKNATTGLQTHLPIPQVVSRAVGQALQNSPQNQIRDPVPGGSDGSNTYSLFNSPWPSGLSVPRTAPKENQHHGKVESVIIQPPVQSVWSRPGPSPLERLLEQQKQRRDSTPH